MSQNIPQLKLLVFLQGFPFFMLFQTPGLVHNIYECDTCKIDKYFGKYDKINYFESAMQSLRVCINPTLIASLLCSHSYCNTVFVVIFFTTLTRRFHLTMRLCDYFHSANCRHESHAGITTRITSMVPHCRVPYAPPILPGPQSLIILTCFKKHCLKQTIF